MIDRSRALVQDEYTDLKPGMAVQWTMVTGADIRISAGGRTAVLTQAGRRLRAEVLAPAGGLFEIRSARPPTPSENPNTGFSILALASPPEAATSDLRVAVVFTPVGDRWPQHSLPEITGLADWR
jgi:hypothetical protein